MSDNDVILQIKGLKTRFFTEDGVVPAVDGVDIFLRRGETLGLVGESGCGKSVTALSIMRLIVPPGRIVQGEVLLDGLNLASLSEEEMCQVRGCQIAMIFQEPMTSLNPVYTIGDQIAEAIIAHNHISASEARERAVAMLRLVGIATPEKAYSSYPHEFSGGMRQRVMIAMALSCRPALLIADEPTTALDVTIQAQILELMKTLKAQVGTALLLITHDLGVVAEMADRVNVMYAGQIVEEAGVFPLFEEPKHPYTQGLLTSIPTLQTKPGERLPVIPGQVPNLLRLPPGCRFAPRCPLVFARCWEEAPALFQVDDDRRVRCFLYDEAP